MAEVSRDRLLATVKSLLRVEHNNHMDNRENFSDLTITCGDYTYHVHKCIVCSQVKFFAKAVKFGAKESHENKINLAEDEPHIVQSLMTYLYESEYAPCLPTATETPPIKPSHKCNTSPWPCLQFMYEYAEKYEASGLKELSKEKFARSCRRFWNTDEFPIAAHHAFSTTPDNDKGLREIVSKTIADHIALVKKPAINALMVEFAQLPIDVLFRQAESNN